MHRLAARMAALDQALPAPYRCPGEIVSDPSSHCHDFPDYFVEPLAKTFGSRERRAETLIARAKRRMRTAQIDSSEVAHKKDSDSLEYQNEVGPVAQCAFKKYTSDNDQEKDSDSLRYQTEVAPPGPCTMSHGAADIDLSCQESTDAAHRLRLGSVQINSRIASPRSTKYRGRPRESRYVPSVGTPI